MRKFIKVTELVQIIQSAHIEALKYSCSEEQLQFTSGLSRILFDKKFVGKTKISIIEFIEVADSLMKPFAIPFKEGICITIDRVLMKTGQYKGFYFLCDSEPELGSTDYYSRKYFR